MRTIMYCRWMCCCYIMLYSIGVVILSRVEQRLSAILHILLVVGTYYNVHALPFRAHRQDLQMICGSCLSHDTFSVLIVDGSPQIICGSCLCCFSFFIVHRDEIHRSSVDLLCVFLRSYHDFLVDIHRTSVYLDKNKTDEIHL